MKFKGTFEELEALFAEAGFEGTWSKKNDTQHQFEFKSGGYFNWYNSKKGSVVIQGNSDEKEYITSLVVPILDGVATTTPRAMATTKVKNNRVFVVYGHDQTARTQLETMLRRWGLEPLILDQLPSKGQTIIEKLEEYSEDVGFAVVLATPDDQGHRRDYPDEITFRARQNVVLELGMMLKYLGRHKVAILLKGQENMEKPSDIHGLIYIPFKDDLQKEAGPNLAKEMIEQGFNIAVKDL